MTHPLAALIGLDIEDIARAVYDAMRFERRDKTPKWVKGGNSNAQVEARATAARILAALEAAPVPDLVEAGKVLEGMTKGKAVQFHPYYCEEAKNAAFTNWDTSHHVSVIREDDGTRYRVGEFRHSSDAAFFQWCVNNVPALIALATAQAAQIEGLEKERDTWKVDAERNHKAADVEYDRAQTAEAALAAERAKTAKLVESLKPFADYMADGGDKNYEGDLLPDTEGVGWVYLTVGDFRRARAAILRALEQEGR